jgi:hypothetical protein
MNGKSAFRFWALLIIGIAVLAGIGLLLSLLGQGAEQPVPTTAPTPTSSQPAATLTAAPLPQPTQEPASTDVSPLATPAAASIVASVNGHPISHAFWTEAVLLDQVMNQLAGQPTSHPDETLERLINEELVLEAFPPEQVPSTEQVKQQIAQFERALGISDADIAAALEDVGLDRATLERTIERVLVIQQGLQVLQSQGHETAAWLGEQRANADITINEQAQSPNLAAIPVAQSQSPLATPSAAALEVQLSTPTPETADESPSPDPATLQVAPDFTLPQVSGGEFTLSEQLARGPVVLVFFQRCG